MEKTPSPWTIVLTGWLGFMFATVGGTAFPRLRLALAPDGTSPIAAIGLLWLCGWVGALAIRAVYYWGKFAITKSVDAYWRRRLPPRPVRPRPAATPKSLLGQTASPAAAPVAAAPAQGGPAFIPRRPDPIDQLTRLATLRDRGVLTDAEFASEKARILSQ
jgi:hypothetical protein